MSAGPRTSPAYAGSEAADFLNTVFGGKEPSDHVLVWLIERKHSAWFSDLGQATAYIDQNHEKDVYIGVALSPANHGRHLRLKIDGGERLPSALVGLWADIDFVDGVHKKANLPPNADAARSVMFPDLPPSVLIHSGGGLQAWWLFKEAERLQDEAAVRDAGDLAMRWNRALRGRAAAKGWDVDSVADLTRVLRVPGTCNRKVPDRPRPVSLLEINEHRYNPGELAEYLDSIAPVLAPAPASRASVGTPTSAPSGLVFDPNATYPAEKFAATCDAEPKFIATWHHKRRDLTDQSPSAYDMAMANIAAQGGWADQEIANLLITHRRKYGADLKLRDSYIAKTIAKARAAFGAPEEIDAVVESDEDPPADEAPVQRAPVAVEPQSAPAPADEEESDSVTKDPLGYLKRQPLFRRIGLASVRKIGRRDATYDLILADGSVIEIGHATDVLNGKHLEAAIAEATTIMMPEPPRWRRIAQAIFLAGGPGEETVLEKTDETEAWVRGYLKTKAVVEVNSQAADDLRGGEKVFSKNGCVYVSGEALRKWIHIQYGERLGLREVGMRLRRIGFQGGKDGRLDIRDSGEIVTRRFWKSPPGFLAAALPTTAQADD